MKSRILPVILTAGLTTLGTLFLAARFNQDNPLLSFSPQKSLPVNYVGEHSVINSSGPVDFQAAAEASVKTVVHIRTTTKARTVVANDPTMQDFFGNLFGPRQYILPPQMGSGSGVIISPDGYIVTNNHVVAGADQLTVTFNDRYTTTAKVIATDPSTDIAVVKVNEKNLPYMEFGNSDDVHLGQWVLAVGYPFSLDATVTAGIVSAKGRSIGINRQQSNTAIEAFIQTDAAVNPGNSGGALVNTSGQLIGINSAIASPTGSYAGYSYAIPSNLVRKVVSDLRQYGTVQRGYLGIHVLDRRSASPAQLSSLGLDHKSGVYVEDVVPGGAAAGGGLKKGDLITQIAGVTVNSEPELLEQVARYKPGDHISVTFSRSDAIKTTTVELKNLAGSTEIVKDESGMSFLGASVRPLNAEEKKKFSVSGGVVVTDPGKGILASSTSMKKNFVIASVNGQTVSNLKDLTEQIAASGGSAQIAGFYPGFQGMYYYSLNGLDDSGGQ